MNKLLSNKGRTKRNRFLLLLGAPAFELHRVLLSIGPSETMHFQVWHDKAGNAPNITDGNLGFPNLNTNKDPNAGLTTVQEGETSTPAPDLSKQT